MRCWAEDLPFKVEMNVQEAESYLKERVIQGAAILLKATFGDKETSRKKSAHFDTSTPRKTSLRP
jgi:hypothetical protein